MASHFISEQTASASLLCVSEQLVLFFHPGHISNSNQLSSLFVCLLLCLFVCLFVSFLLSFFLYFGDGPVHLRGRYSRLVNVAILVCKFGILLSRHVAILMPPLS